MKYYCIKQHDITDCGAACLATICKQFWCQSVFALLWQLRVNKNVNRSANNQKLSYYA